MKAQTSASMTSTRSDTPAARKVSGFTLIELLVVMVLLGLLASIGLVTVGTGNQDRELENEVQRLHAVLRMAAEEAIFSNTEIGAVIEDDGYAFLNFNEEDGKWEQAPQNFLRAYTLPEWMLIDFRREGEERRLAGENVAGDDSVGAQQDEAYERPDFMLLSSGEVTPFVIGLEIQGSEDSRIEIRTDEQGEIVLPSTEEEV